MPDALAARKRRSLPLLPGRMACRRPRQDTRCCCCLKPVAAAGPLRAVAVQDNNLPVSALVVVDTGTVGLAAMACSFQTSRLVW